MVDGTAGLKGDGKTRIKYSGLTGSLRSRTNYIFFDAGGTQVATGTIESVATNEVTIDGKPTGFILSLSRAKKTVTAVGNAPNCNYRFDQVWYWYGIVRWNRR